MTDPHKQMGRVLAKARAENDRINLDALIAAVEVGAIGPYHSPGAFKALGFSQMSRASSAYHGSLDAAKALHDALLPGWEWILDGHGPKSKNARKKEKEGYYTSTAQVYIWRRKVNGRSYTGKQYGADNPARAWLLAILKAYRATMEESK